MKIISTLKENNEDFEFYPTTQEIVDNLCSHLLINETFFSGVRHDKRILDIGCGNGSFFEKLKKHKDFYAVKKFGIEKSNILANSLPDDVVLLGSDFHEQTLIDKQVDLIFCNPPYSEFEEWAEKIILEGNSKNIALVIPTRWKHNNVLKICLEKRNYKAKVIGTYNFMNAERKARAIVDLVFITQGKFGGKNAFDVWFDDNFKIKAEKEKIYHFDFEGKVKKSAENAITLKGDAAEMLVQFYNADLENLLQNYKKLEELDADLLFELKVDVSNLKKALQERLQGLKAVYWDLLFKKYDKITTKLTSRGRESLLKRLNDNTFIDFTMKNIVQLTLWIVRHSNTLFDEQISEYFYSLCTPENIHRYKSNKRWNEDDWRYIKDTFDKRWCCYDEKQERLKKSTHFQLDYRIVVADFCNFSRGYFQDEYRISTSFRNFVNDTLVIGSNLGFELEDINIPNEHVNLSDDEFKWWKNFDIKMKTGEVFANVKAYQNGNRHIKFCKQFMQKLNVEMARINGWLQDKSEAVNELELPVDFVDSVWGSNFKINENSGIKLLGVI